MEDGVEEPRAAALGALAVAEIFGDGGEQARMEHPLAIAWASEGQKLHVRAVQRGRYMVVCFHEPGMFGAHTPSHFRQGKASGRGFPYVDNAGLW
jgi:hypothetical protein